MPIPRFLTRGLHGLALAAAATGAVHADVLYEQPFAETANGGYFASTLSGFLQFDSFVLSQDATITSVGWYGVDLNELIDITPINPTAFTVALYADDAAGQPGALLSFSVIGQSAGAEDTGVDLLGLTLYHYSGALNTAFQAQAGTTYWIGISDPTTNANWFWASGAGPDGVHAGRVGGVDSLFEDDMAFTLAGTVAAVPEPSTALLWALGLVGVLGAGARRSRRGG